MTCEMYTEVTLYCKSGNFSVFNFLRISDLGTFHEVYNSRIFTFL